MEMFETAKRMMNFKEESSILPFKTLFLPNFHVLVAV